jgi:allophanate hydrolase
MSALRSIADWQAAYRSGAALGDLLPALRARLAACGHPVYLHVASDAALLAQMQALQQRAAGFASSADRQAALPLYGVPFVVKDNIDVADAPTTAACPAFAHTAARHATAVQRLLDAGAVWLAKTNLDQFATGLVGTRSPYGAPESVLAPGRVSGGSSSGSAVAVARGDVPFALGTDTAGSGRVPAAFNGLVGLKPTPGRVSTAGVLPACRTLDCVSVLAHRVDDAAAVLAVIEGADEADAYSVFSPGSARLSSHLRLGIPAHMPALDDGYAAAFDSSCKRALAAGHVLVQLDFSPLFEVAELLYSGPWVAERHAVVRALLQQQPGSLDPIVRGVIEQAARYTATDAFEAQYRLREASVRLQALWRDVDLLLVPSTTNHPTLADIAADPLGSNARLGTFTNFVNLLGWCALAVPAGTAAGGLPFGITFIAQANMDAALAGFGSQWLGEAAGAAPSAPAVATAPTLPLAVVGAHLSGLPLNGQLLERGATLRCATRTAPQYRLFALPGTTPPKPGLQRVTRAEDGEGCAIALEVWDMPLAAVGSFLALIPSPLSLGSIVLQDGSAVHGFLCEPWALQGATDISASGGWRAHLASLAAR